MDISRHAGYSSVSINKKLYFGTVAAQHVSLPKILQLFQFWYIKYIIEDYMYSLLDVFFTSWKNLIHLIVTKSKKGGKYTQKTKV